MSNFTVDGHFEADEFEEMQERLLSMIDDYDYN